MKKKKGILNKIYSFMELRYKPFWDKVYLYSTDIALMCIGLAYFIIIWKAKYISHLPFEVKLNTEVMRYSINPIFLTVNLGFLIMIAILLSIKFKREKEIRKGKDI